MVVVRRLLFEGSQCSAQPLISATLQGENLSSRKGGCVAGVASKTIIYYIRQLRILYSSGVHVTRVGML